MSFYDRCGNKKKLSIIGGPCVFECMDHALMMATKLKEQCDIFGFNFIYKTSFEKANRTSINSFTGVGFDEAFYGMQTIQQKGIEVLTDVHEEWHCNAVAADIIQIPAFLCRQTNLLKAAAESGKIVNVKKGQFLSPQEVPNIIEKLTMFGAKGIMITERGTTFGYNNLVVDMRSLEYMRENCNGFPIIMDCTHAVQSPGGLGDKSGGDREMAKVLARAAVAVGVAGIFMEIHQDPNNAPSDGPNMIKLEDIPMLFDELSKLDNIRKSYLI